MKKARCINTGVCVVVSVHGKKRKGGREEGEKRVVLKYGTLLDNKPAVWLRQGK